MATLRHYPTCKKCYREDPYVTEFYIEAHGETISLCTICQYNFIEWMLFQENREYLKNLYKFIEEF